MTRYQITVRYTTPGGRASEYTDTVTGESYEAAKVLALRLLGFDPRRRVDTVTGFTAIIL